MSRTCNTKDCYTTIPIYSRYCLKHEETTTSTDVIIIDTQPTHNTHEACCCECYCQDGHCCCFDCSSDCECCSDGECCSDSECCLDDD